MTNTPAQPTAAGVDAVVPFAVEALDVRGRVINMGPVLNSMLTRHKYPAPVNKLLSEAIVLTAMLGSTLKFEGRLTLQAQTDGAVSTLVVDFNAPDGLRAMAQFSEDKVAEVAAKDGFKPDHLLGKGHLAFTIDQGAHTSRYQGIVVLNGTTLEEAAHEYFQKSEQIPTFVRLGVAEVLTKAEEGGADHSWAAGGIMVQFLPQSLDRLKQADIHPGDAPEGHEAHEIDEDDAWVEARSLVETVKDDELIDPSLTVEGLLYRLFHERGASVFSPQEMADKCTCSEEKITAMMQNFSEVDKTEMKAEGTVHIKCDFCSKDYELDANKVFED
ncbi:MULTISPECIES: Hsp33 family molecular chaperone [unclassified Pseudovibrio]|uniref:Hsp33 family molecular chaperone n=1 Tax=unclassified Pseudovibrio TaxID=2627060 RepID=UPI0007AECC03|nr:MULTISPECIES: Hsp33 family molecular chaperone [unclassified Pseudovibrio]KZL03455.1 33 kDa chaperonin [Pseudovibrio sp. W74]KZL10157.1 33 kDa chaperonin [Pseudovibrio sp. Ad14]